MILRPYQEKAISQIYSAWNAGKQNVLIVLPTGAGKTVIISKIIEQNAGYSIAIAHRSELVSQLSLALARYGVRHNIIAQKNTIRSIINLHMNELKKSFYDPQAKSAVASVDTLIKLDAATPWFKKINLVVQDEGHHPLKENKWGLAANLFPQAFGLYPTATPIRADGCGLGRHADGIIDELIVGPQMRELIKLGYLTDYVICAPSTIDLSHVPISSTGDFSLPSLRTVVHQAQITGDVVSNYLKFAGGKLGVTFAVDISAAEEIAIEYKKKNIPAEVISSKTPDTLRHNIMRKFRNREIMQIVNVDLLGEGVDVPAIEVVSMARPTCSYALYCQQFGRALRPMTNKSHAIIIDHVDNWLRHGLPDKPRVWSLDRRERRGKSNSPSLLKTCLNPKCMAVYEKTFSVCPYCQHKNIPISRSSPEEVDGDLSILDPEILAKLRGEIDRIDGAPRIPPYLDSIAQRGIQNRHRERQENQAELRNSIALYAGYLKNTGASDSEIYRQFYFTFGVDIMSAQALGSKNAIELNQKIIKYIDVNHNTS